MAIKSFRSKETEKIFNGEKSRTIPSEIHRAAYRKLMIIHLAKDLRDIKNLPGNRYEELHEKKRKGQSSIRINDQYRICFIWDKCDAYEVAIEDYH